MRLGHGSHSRCPNWVKILFIIGAALALPGLPLAVAQTGPLLENTTPAQETARPVEPTTAPLSKPMLTSDKTAFRYEIQVLEIPAEKMTEQSRSWQLLGSAQVVAAPTATPATDDDSKVVPAGFTSSNSSYSIRKSEPLDEQTIQGLIDDGTILTRPKIMAYEGRSAEVFAGGEIPLVTSYEAAKDEAGNETATMQPVVTKIPVGIKLSLNGKLSRDRRSVSLQLGYASSELSNVDTFTFETEGGPVTVQQPNLSSTGVNTTVNIPVGKTIAVSGGSRSKLVTKQTSVPILRKVPYVNRLFKNVSATKVDIATVVLIRCEIMEAAEMQSMKPSDGEQAPRSTSLPQGEVLLPPMAPQAGK